MRLSLIVAMTRSGVIGRGGGLPWHLSADLKRFKCLTMGHHLIMGRKTFDSLGRPLPGRTSIVITRQPDYRAVDGVLAVHTLDKALWLAREDEEPFVIGGGQLFHKAWPRIDRLYVTWVEAEVAGDTWFPAWEPDEWIEVERQPHAADAKNEYDTTFCMYDRPAP
jgi:dihydrofolate reductase